MGMLHKLKDKKKSKSKDEEKLKKKKKKDKDGAQVTRKKKGEKKSKSKKEAPETRPIKTKMTRTALIDHLVDETAVDKKSVKKIFFALEEVMKGSLIYKKGLGEFTWPGLFKIATKFKPKQKGGKKMPNRFKPGEFVITKDKPASVRVKIRPMKKLKDAAAYTKGD